MRWIHAIILSIVLTVSIPLIYIIIPNLLPNVGSSGTTIAGEHVTIEVEHVSENKYVFPEPPTWRDVFMEASKDKGILESDREITFRYLGPFTTIDIVFMWQDYMMNMNNNPCKVVSKKYGGLEGRYGVLFKNNCEMLRKLFFSNEREWYTAFALVKKLANEVKKNYDKYDLWLLAYKKDNKLVFEFYNTVIDTERKELEKRVEDMINSYDTVVLLLHRGIRRWWYDVYKYLETKRIPYIIVLNVEHNKPVKEPLNELVPRVAPGLESIFEINAIVFKNGEPVGISTDFGCDRVSVSPCHYDTYRVLKAIYG
ncbi:MAG: hypothetical protein DRO40_05835 [Thermoprotei archaeon]|nr:MAG: hypothetical protein DRO40_05835 [Thermoprotei archaeon]